VADKLWKVVNRHMKEELAFECYLRCECCST